jgi:CMP-N-acetylneuraminic acid synthetase
MTKEILAIIPARCGSKSIKDKNIKEFSGKPLLAHSIDHAKKSKLISRVIISTDSEDYAKIAKEYGAEAPFIRPSEFAQDDTPDLPVFEHALRWLKDNENYEPELVINLRPTTPQRDSKDIDEAIKKLSSSDADSLRSMVLVKDHPYWMFKIDDNSVLTAFDPNNSIKQYPRRQLLPEIYITDGSFDIFRPKNIIKGDLFGEKILGHKIDESKKTIDIDSESDFKLAENIQKTKEDQNNADRK